MSVFVWHGIMNNQIIVKIPVQNSGKIREVAEAEGRRRVGSLSVMAENMVAPTATAPTARMATWERLLEDHQKEVDELKASNIPEVVKDKMLLALEQRHESDLLASCGARPACFDDARAAAGALPQPTPTHAPPRHARAHTH